MRPRDRHLFIYKRNPNMKQYEYVFEGTLAIHVDWIDLVYFGLEK